MGADINTMKNYVSKIDCRQSCYTLSSFDILFHFLCYLSHKFSPWKNEGTSLKAKLSFDTTYYVSIVCPTT